MNDQSELNFTSFLRKIPKLNVELAIKAIGGSEEIYEKMMRQVMRFIPSHIEQMDKFIGDDKDLVSFAGKIHGIKGSLMQVGYHCLAKYAARLEKEAREGHWHFCEVNYYPFKEQLMQFYDLVKIAQQSSEKESGNAASEKRPAGQIKDYCGVLENARQSAQDYDSLLAAECLLPLTKLYFGEKIDGLIAEAMDKIEIFEPIEALPALTQILNAAKGL